MKAVLAILFGAILPLLLMANTTLAQSMSVQVKSAHLKKKPNPLAELLTTLPYGDQLQVKTEEGPWLKVMHPKTGTTGWVHSSALSARQIVINPANRHIEAAHSGTISLAGQGFNLEVEKQYKEQKQLDYTQIDRMESVTPSQEEIRAFAKSGNLGKGARQ